MQRHLERVQRFESLLEPFSPSSDAASPPPDAPSSLQAVGESVPGLGRGPQSAEQWRRDELRRLCFGGIPDEPKHLRPAAYAFLLSLPPPPSLLSQYTAFLSDISARISALPSPAPQQHRAKEDKLLGEIEQDVERTFGALAWFGAEVGPQEEEARDVLWERMEALERADRAQAEELSNGGAAEDAEGAKEEVAPSASLAATAPRPRTRRQALLRPLFVYAYLNPGVSYVQGMSYLAAVPFFVFSAAPSSPLHAEAATFFVLGALLAQLRDLYVPTLDAPALSAPPAAAAVGLGATVARFNSLLLFLDPAVADALDRKGVDLSALVMRWLTTLFANEFPLPDVVRVWDRVLSLYPPEEDHQAVEALSPVLSHLLDLALAVIELERSTILSPFAKLPKILGLLQDLPIEGEGIDRLLRTAADIRERRSGRAKRTSVSSTPTRSGTVFGRRLWSASPSKPADAAAADYELDDRSSAAGSDASRPSRFGTRFGSLAFSSPRSSATADLADNVTVVEGKVLPPPPARVDQPRETIASLIEEELRAEAEYGVEDEEVDDAEAQSLQARMATGWGGLKSSLSRFAASDTAALLQKRATNLQLAAAQSASTASARLQSSDAAAALFKAQSNAAAKAQLLRAQIAQDAPDRLAKLRDAGGRLVASTGPERSAPDRRPGSPRETPFTPPGALRDRDRDVSPLSSPRLGATSSDMTRGASNGPKPLLLSSAARRARSDSEDPPSSVVFARSPSHSPVLSRTGGMLSPDLSIPPLSRSPSAHGRSYSHFDSPSRANHSSAGAFRPRSPSLQHAPALQDDDSPIISRRVQDGAAGLRRGGPSIRAAGEVGLPAAKPAQGSRGGWSLSDAPVRPRGSPPREEQGGQQLPPLDLGFDPSLLGESVASSPAVSVAKLTLRDEPVREEEPFLPPREEPFAPPPREEPFSPPSEAPFVPPSEALFAPPTASPRDEPFSPPSDSTSPPPPPRGSSLSLSASQPASSTRPSAPPRKSSLASSVSSAATPAAPAPAPAAAPAKLTRRPPAQRKRTSRSGASASIDLLSGAEARRVASEFLTRSGSGASAHRRRASEALSGGVGGGGSRMSGVEWDAEGLLEAYGAEEAVEGGR
ncbi:hypothetical protein JCM10449v2_000890 [Rhodotorula kratochvilovae]